MRFDVRSSDLMWPTIIGLFGIAHELNSFVFEAKVPYVLKI